MTEHEVGRDSEEVSAFNKTYRDQQPFPYASLNDVLDHFDYVVKLAGVEHVGIGSDYDGVGDSLPIDLKSVADYPNLVRGLMDREYSDSDIKKMLGGNLMRVWKQTEEHAAKH